MPYVEARYAYHYAITAEDLAWLTGWVEILSQLVAEICAERPGERPEATEGAAR